MSLTLGIDETSVHEESHDPLEPASMTEEWIPGVRRNAMLTETIRVIRPIASGGMGSIWLAEHLGLEIPVAVKFLRSSLSSHPGAIKRFQREAAAASRIRSAHVVQVLDHGIAGGRVPYIVMELLEGKTLDALLTERTRLTLHETAEIVRQAGRVLAKAHEIGIIHRDIKPENLFLVDGVEAPFVKVLDFGIAKSSEHANLAHITSEGSVVGTPQYMSPEQMTGHGDVGPASDVWSLGVVAYVCLTGIMPYAGSSLAEIAVAIDRGEIIRASALSEEVTEEVDRWLRRALDPSLEYRFRSAPEMVAALDAALAEAAPVSGDRPSMSLRSAGAPAPTRTPSELFYGRRFRPQTTWRMRGWLPLSGVLCTVLLALALLGWRRAGGPDVAAAARSLARPRAAAAAEDAVPTRALRPVEASALPAMSPERALAQPSRVPVLISRRPEMGD